MIKDFLIRSATVVVCFVLTVTLLIGVISAGVIALVVNRSEPAPVSTSVLDTNHCENSFLHFELDVSNGTA